MADLRSADVYSGAAPDRGCVGDQPQQLRRANTDVSAPFNPLRLVLCTQPRSGTFALRGQCKDASLTPGFSRALARTVESLVTIFGPAERGLTLRPGIVFLQRAVRFSIVILPLCSGFPSLAYRAMPIDSVR